MSALCTDQSKNKNPQKNKVQCLDVYELFDDCVEHDHFYTRRFLIKDPGFALGVCCLLVTWIQEVAGKVLGGQTLWESSGLGVLPLQAFLEIPGTCKRCQMGWHRERGARRVPGTRRWGRFGVERADSSSFSLPRALGRDCGDGAEGRRFPRASHALGLPREALESPSLEGSI